MVAQTGKTDRQTYSSLLEKGIPWKWVTSRNDIQSS